jgi:hypothetical protein
MAEEIRAEMVGDVLTVDRSVGDPGDVVQEHDLIAVVE